MRLHGSHGSHCKRMRERLSPTAFTAWRLALALCACASGGSGGRPLGQSEQPEAYFNGTSYIRLPDPLSLHRLVGISFRSCVGGELFSQRYESHTLQVTAVFEEVVAAFTTPARGRRTVSVRTRPLDNRWHFVALRYDQAAQPAPTLALTVDKLSAIVANATYNVDLLSTPALESPGAVLLVGSVFSGCVREGPQLEFHAEGAQAQNVLFGDCPLTTDECKDRRDVLTIPPIDHCYHEPCMRHGTCISRHDRYECHCTARYTGNNCEQDQGDPCDSSPCTNHGTCVEDRFGDYSCVCPDKYYGKRCEQERSLDPLCMAQPCRHGGACSVPPGSDRYVCTCQPGYMGDNCETDMDECVAAGATACDNGGRCVDAVNNYTCDCTGTGYAGVRCEENVNECLEEPLLCGHGVCYDTYGGFVCACQPGYAGDRCQTKLSPCAASPCGPAGTCVDSGAGWRCQCARGWTGARCTVPLASCDGFVCPAHSRCVQIGTTPSAGQIVTSAPKQVQCLCDPGFYGAPGLSPNCSVAEDACAAGVCLNGASCSRIGDVINCTCAPGFRGMYCEQAVGKAMSELNMGVETCADSPCLHARACNDMAGGFRCDCSAGWTGSRCDVPACSPDYCLNGGACKTTPTGARCQCRPGHVGARCERSTANVDPCTSRPCRHGGTCRAAGADFACECRPGYAGDVCENAIDCRAVGCAEGQVCLETDLGFVCQPAVVKSPCSQSPCNNGTCQALSQTDVECTCDAGTTGRFCDVDIDECATPKVCNFGVCFNTQGSFNCYCTPGYTGERCDLDIDECLSVPCRNNGTCQNLKNNYTCVCVKGFTGKDCSVNIDECETNPCAAGATCVDGVDSYSCVCPQGVTGSNCEIDIDDCESAPCRNGGICLDALNNYTCDCAGTGYAGADCSLSIDECAPEPCRNGGVCRDLVNDYECRCPPGYTGKNCSVDIPECESNPCQYDGVCLERSDRALYRERGPEPVRVGPHPSMLLPDVFYGPFSYENASGFECVCVPGVRGARCEVNVDECASSPCGAWGVCEDGVGGYRCVCRDGFEGDHCQVDVDECERYKPCAHGQCYDRRASYHCECQAGWGGRNCSVWLTGCAVRPCRNNGTCLPWLLNESEHRFNCSCGPGFYGPTCERITTMSLEGHSYAEVRTVRDEGYDISFRFQTTLGNGLLAIGKGQTFYFLELANGRLNLHSSLLNKWEGVFIGSDLNNSRWQKVFVTINSSHLVLAANEEQTIYPISQNEVSNSSATSFPVTYLGGAGSTYAPFTHGPVYFVGCFQDVVINGQWVLPDASETSDSTVTADPPTTSPPDDAPPSAPQSTLAQATMYGVAASCPRTPQCTDNPCKSGGTCEDRWTSFTCTCPRPHLGRYCQYNYTAATFGHEGARPGSVVSVRVREAARKAVHAALEISMFIRTREPTGQIFYLGSEPRYGVPEETSVSASLKAGELLVSLRFNQTPEEYTVGGTRLDNGYLHLIQVVRNSTLVQVKLNGTEYFRKSISAAKQLDAQMLYLGGPPPAPSPPPETTPAPGGSTPAGAVVPPAAAVPLTTPPTPPPQAYFKGVIQDVQVSNGMREMIVEFFPLSSPELSLPPAFGDVTVDAAGVLPGVVSDDTCASRPCLHNATCRITWNDFTCECPRGYKGKTCAEVEFCQLQGCPTDSQCRNLDRGYECVANATFDGVNTSLAYQLELGDEDEAFPAVSSLTLTYRSKTGGTLLYAEYSPGGNDTTRSIFSLGVYRDQLSVQWQLGGDQLRQQRHFRKTSPDLDWTVLHFAVSMHEIRGGFGDWQKEDKPALSAQVDGVAWQELMTRGLIHLGGMRPNPSGATTVGTSQADSSLYTMESSAQKTDSVTEPAPWITNAEEWNVDSSVGEYFKGCIGEVHIGDMLLPFHSKDTLFVGPTAPLLAALPHYNLVSGGPWNAEAGLGCALCLERDCEHGGHCEDMATSYSCTCPRGYAGDRCERDVDECVGHRCANNAKCVDGVAGYTCVCAAGWEGPLCDVDVDECASGPCRHGGACSDAVGAFVCACGPDWTGPTCASSRRTTCAAGPCAPGRARCLDSPPDPPTGNNFTCKCSPGYEGALCESAFCELRPCLNGGSCVTDADRPACACPAGYTGPRCESETDECASGAAGAAACRHGGVCVDAFNDFYCDCSGTGYEGARCQLDVDECSSSPCAPGVCENLNGSYLCHCNAGLCGVGCAVPDPCYALGAPTSLAWVSDANVTASRALAGPCENGAVCYQQCTDVPDYRCECIDGWSGKNCSEQVGTAEPSGAGPSAAVLIGVSAALAALAVVAGVVLALAAQARSKRATRGTYSPSSQEYSNPRAEHLHNALKPPPEERLI